MDSPRPDEGMEPSLPTDPAGWIAELRRQVAAIKVAADEFAFRWSAPEGRFVATLIGAMQTLTRLVVATQASLEATAQQAHATALTELESVRELRRTVEAIKGQAQAVQMLS